MSARAVAIYAGRQRVPALDPGDRGLAYGDGLFETLRVHAGRPVWWEAHLARLGRGAAVLGLDLPPADWLAAEAAALLADGPSDAVLKLVLTRGPGGRGYSPPSPTVPTLVLSRHDAPPPAGPLSLRWATVRLASQPVLAGLKHLNRLEQVLARLEPGASAADESLMLDGADRVVCATAANLFVLRDGRWLTPPLGDCGIAGIARAWVLAQDIGAAEAVLAPADVETAEAVFLCNAVRGILPVGRLGDRRWAPHPSLDDLRRRLGRDVPAFDPGS